MSEEGDRRAILVIANRTCECPALHEDIAERAAAGADVLVVAPALNSRVRHWVSDTDAAVEAAEERLATAVAELRRRGVDARGEVGDAEPLHAIADALAGFEADEILFSTHPPGRSHWLEKNLIEAARSRFEPPVTHLVSGYGAEATAA
jgi:GABA permease